MGEPAAHLVFYVLLQRMLQPRYVCKTNGREMVCAVTDALLDQYLSRNTFVILDDVSATTGAKRADNKPCIDTHGSNTRYQQVSLSEFCTIQKAESFTVLAPEARSTPQDTVPKLEGCLCRVPRGR